MLENIDTIDWTSLGAAQIPHLLQDLSSTYEVVRLKAYDALMHMLVAWSPDAGLYYGFIYADIQHKAILPVIPFLIELLREKAMLEKVRILILLREIASYVELGPIVGALALVVLSPSEQANYDDHARQLFNAVMSGFDTYTQLLNDEDDEVRSYAAYLIGLLRSGQ